MKRYLFAVAASLVIAFCLPSFAAPLATLQGGASGGSVGSLPNAMAQPTTYVSEWKDASGTTQRVITQRGEYDKDETGKEHAKRHKQDVDDLAAQFPPATGQAVPWWAGHHATPDGVTSWRSPYGAGIIGVRVVDQQWRNETLGHFLWRHVVQGVEPLEFEMPAL